MSVTVYCGMRPNGVWKASKKLSEVAALQGVFETELDKVHEKVYLLKTYYGYVMNGPRGKQKRKDVVVTYGKVWGSVGAIKQSPEWKKLAEKAHADEDNHIITDFQIASKDPDTGEAWEIGKVSDDEDRMFNTQIIGLWLEKKPDKK